MEAGSIFRSKSIDKVSSPEQLNDYIQVTTPSIWLIFLAVIILLAGTITWGFLGEIHVNTEDGEQVVAPVTCIFPVGKD